jgi:hypothetical protein
VAAGLLVAFVYFHIIKFYWRAYKLRHISGPFIIPVLGSLYDIRALSVRPVVPAHHPRYLHDLTHVNLGDMHHGALLQWYDWLESLRSQYGKVFRVVVFTRPYIVMLDKAVSGMTAHELSNVSRTDLSPAYMCA